MKRYNGNTGRVERIPEPEPLMSVSSPANSSGVAYYAKPPSQSGIFGGLGGLLSKFSISSLEIEDLILIAVLYLLYRESGDIEFLLIAGAMLFL